MRAILTAILLAITVISCGQESEDSSVKSDVPLPTVAPKRVTHSHSITLNSAQQEQLAALLNQTPLPTEAQNRVLDFYGKNLEKIDNQRYVSVLDFTEHSSRKRYFLFDVEEQTFSTHLVAHGVNSESSSGVATMFSNTVNSNQSSLGAYITGIAFDHWRLGYSMRLHGKEETNDKAYIRGIIMHQPKKNDYVSEDFIARHGRIGRSHGCPVLSREDTPVVINKIKGGSLLYIYHESMD